MNRQCTALHTLRLPGGLLGQPGHRQLSSQHREELNKLAEGFKASAHPLLSMHHLLDLNFLDFQGREAFVFRGWYCSHSAPKTSQTLRQKSLRHSLQLGYRWNSGLVRGFLVNTDIKMNLPSSGGTGMKCFGNSYMKGLLRLPHLTPSKSHCFKPHLLLAFTF